MKLELATYSPSEAELVTKVPQTTVRNWRRLGHLPRQQGRARYTIADLLFLSVMQMLVSRGITPELAKEHAGEVARAIFLSVIWSRDGYSDAAYAAASAGVGENSPDLIANARAALGDAFSMEALASARKQEFLMEAAARAFGLSGVKAPSWFIIWSNGEMQSYYDADISEETFFGNMSYDEYVHGPVMLFCLGALAAMVIDRLPRPAIVLQEEK